MSSSLAILVSAEMLISFIADSEMAWAGAACGCRRRSAAAPLRRRLRLAAAALAVPGGGLVRRAASWLAAFSGGAAVAVATPPFGLGVLRSSSTVRPVLRPSALRPAARGCQTTIRSSRAWRVRSARVSLSTLVPMTPRGQGCDCSPCPRVQVRLESRDAASRRAAARPALPRPGEIRLRQPVEFLRRRVAAARVAVARQIDQIQRRRRSPLHAVEVGQACLAWRRARARQRLPHQRVDQARFADIGPADQGDLRQPVTRKVTGARGAGDELGRYLQASGSGLQARGSRRHRPRWSPEPGARSPRF